MNTCHTTHPPDRSLSGLQPAFRAAVTQLLALHPDAAVHEAHRTDARQACVRAAGSSWVTRSLHQDGWAVDIHFRTAPHFPPRSDPRWGRLIATAARLGIDNGYTLWGTDTNHFQASPALRQGRWRPVALPAPTPDPSTSSPTLTPACRTALQSQLDLHSALWHDLRQSESSLAQVRQQLHQGNEALRTLLKTK